MAANTNFRYRGLLAGVAASAIAVSLLHFEVFRPIESQLYDQNFHLFWTGQDTSEIVIIGIDPSSLESIGHWPWPRMFHAEVIRQAARDGAKVIGVDIGFFEPDRGSPENDVELVDAIAETGNVILPVVVEPRRSGESVGLAWARNLPELEQAALGTGHVHIDSSDDGIVREVLLSSNLGDERSWGWSLEVLRAYLDIPRESIRPVGGNRLAVGDIEIPVKMAPRSIEGSADRILADYAMNIGWFGGRGAFPRIAADSVINGDFPEGYFQGKIVLYGMYSPGFDEFTTPFSHGPVPGVEVQASIIQTVLKERFIRSAPIALTAVVSILAGLLVGFVYERFETRVAAAALIVLMIVSLAAYVYLFNFIGYWIQLTSIHVAMILSFVFSLMLKMNQVNVALDEEILNLSQAAAQGARGGEDQVAHAFRSAEPTLRDVLAIPAAALFKVDRSKGHMTLAAQYGLSESRRPRDRYIKIGATLRGLLISLDPISVDGVNEHPLSGFLKGGGGRHGLHHTLFVPLLAQGETVGALVVCRPKGSPFRVEEEELLKAVAGELGTLWYSASLYSRLDRMSSNPLARLTYKNQERRIQTLSVLSESVRGEKALMGAIMDSIADGVVVTDALGTIRLLNPKAKDILGLYAENAVGQNATEFIRRFHDVSYEQIREKFQQVIEREKTFTMEVKLVLPTTRYYTLSLGPVRSREGLVKGIVAVLSDITELKEMDQMKTDLMSMVTHEIRTPLATVRGFAQILLKGGIPAEKSSEFLGIINRQSNRLVNLVNDFLDISRIESGRQVITKGPLDINKLVQNAVTDLQPLAGEKDIKLRYKAPATAISEILADRNLIEQALINLVSNGIKYSPKGAWVEVALAKENSSVRIDVKDNGLGIPKEALPRLFEKFYRVRCDDRKDIIGTGLGLSLVKQIVEVHGGAITVQSEHGVGSTFTFTIPANAPPESRDAGSKETRVPDAIGALQG
jgi:two-component system phosphate regulon sensor histidine kinase PhoR